MKALKVLLSLIVTLVLLLIVTIITLPLLVNPNDFKQEIAEQVQSKTGLELQIEGDLSLSVFPWLGIKTGRISLAQPKEVSKEGTLVSLDEANLNVKLKPLLNKELEVDTILLKAPRIEILVNKAGLSSIDAITAKFQGEKEAKANKSADTSTNEVAAIAALSIAGINISDGYVLYDDKKTGATYEVKNLNISSGDLLGGNSAPVSLQGLMHGKASGKAIEPVDFSLSSNVTLNKDQLQATANDVNLSITMGTLPLTFTAPAIEVDANKTMASVPQFIASAYGIEISGNTVIKNWKKTPTATGKIKTNTFNAQTLLKNLAVDYTPSDSAALSKVSAATNFTASPKGISLQHLNINMDESALTGYIAIVTAKNTNYRFDLALDKIKIDPYLPVTTQEDSSAENISATEGLLAPLAIFNNIYAQGNFRAQSVQAKNLKVSDIKINVKSNSKATTITQSLALYKGTLAGKAALTKSKNPTLTINTSIKNVDLEPLLIDAEVTDQFSGTGNLDSSITATETNGKTSNKGTVKVLAKNGAIKGVDIKKVLDDAQSAIDALRGKSASSATSSEEDETRFAEMSATLLLNDNIVSNNDLSVQAPLFRIGGNGTVDIAQQTLDYLAKIVVVNTNSGQGGKSLDKLKGITIPVRFSGSLSAPEYKIDTSALLKANTKKAVEKEKDKLKDKLLDKLGIKRAKTNESNEAAESAESTQQQAAPEQEPEPAKENESVEDQLKEKLKRKLFDKLF